MSNHNRTSSSVSQDDRVIQDIQKKIVREKGIAQGALAMKNSTKNVSVQQKCDTSIREAQKNIEYLEQRLQQLHIRKRNSVIAQGSNTSPDLNSPNSLNNPYSSEVSPYTSQNPQSANDGMCIFLLFYYFEKLVAQFANSLIF